MKRQHHGILSLILLFMAVGIGAISIVRSSRLMAITYMLISAISFVLIVYSYCSKCSCRKHTCGHVLPGIITRFLPQRIEARYTIMDYIGVALPLIVIVVFPQYWLIDNILLIVSFWSLVLVAVVDILLKVCKGCENKYCSIRKTG